MAQAQARTTWRNLQGAHLVSSDDESWLEQSGFHLFDDSEEDEVHSRTAQAYVHAVHALKGPSLHRQRLPHLNQVSSLLLELPCPSLPSEPDVLHEQAFTAKALSAPQTLPVSAAPLAEHIPLSLSAEQIGLLQAAADNAQRYLDKDAADGNAAGHSSSNAEGTGPVNATQQTARWDMQTAIVDAFKSILPLEARLQAPMSPGNSAAAIAAAHKPVSHASPSSEPTHVSDVSAAAADDPVAAQLSGSLQAGSGRSAQANAPTPSVAQGKQSRLAEANDSLPTHDSSSLPVQTRGPVAAQTIDPAAASVPQPEPATVTRAPPLPGASSTSEMAAVTSSPPTAGPPTAGGPIAGLPTASPTAPSTFLPTRESQQVSASLAPPKIAQGTLNSDPYPKRLHSVDGTPDSEELAIMRKAHGNSLIPLVGADAVSPQLRNVQSLVPHKRKFNLLDICNAIGHFAIGQQQKLEIFLGDSHNSLVHQQQIHSIAALFGVRAFQSQHPERFHEKYHLTQLVKRPEAGILTLHGDMLVYFILELAELTKLSNKQGGEKYRREHKATLELANAVGRKTKGNGPSALTKGCVQRLQQLLDKGYLAVKRPKGNQQQHKPALYPGWQGRPRDKTTLHKSDAHRDELAEVFKAGNPGSKGLLKRNGSAAMASNVPVSNGQLGQPLGHVGFRPTGMMGPFPGMMQGPQAGMGNGFPSHMIPHGPVCWPG
ncbi:hypothetical protein WJX79_001141 [Trebouxia sp. C0005]